MQHNTRVTSFEAVVFAGGSEDLLKIDLSTLNIQFHAIKSKEFRGFLRSIMHEDKIENEIMFYDQYDTKMPSNVTSIYALFPISVQNELDKNLFALIQTSLLLMFPSNLQIITDLGYSILRNNGYMRSYTASRVFRPNDFIKNNSLSIGQTTPEAARTFIKRYTEIMKEKHFLDLPIQSYYNSFFQDELRLC
jgi:hypothetical protein